MFRAATCLVILSTALACAPADDSPPTPAAADAFVAQAEEQLAALGQAQANANWVQATYITYDSTKVAAAAQERITAAAVDLANASTRFDDLDLALHQAQAGNAEAGALRARTG